MISWTSWAKNSNIQKYWNKFPHKYWGPSWLWSYGSWIYNYLCNLCLSPLMLWVRISIGPKCTTLCGDKVWQWLVTGWWFSPGPLVSSTNKTEILLKVALNTIKQTNKPLSSSVSSRSSSSDDSSFSPDRRSCTSLVSSTCSSLLKQF